mmetsp:Transcript_42712/g.70466  ORF Transcript_42712/g.70466 Transcript_42712/m.70466 type:complete len:366 (+) Transcript_42712:23-1120(+)
MSQQPKPSATLLSALQSADKNKLRKTKTKELSNEEQKIAAPKYKPDHKKAPKTILIIDFQTNWYRQFKDAALADGTPLIIEQTLWTYIDIESSSNSNEKLIVDVQPNSTPIPFTSQSKARQISPDFVLIRNFPTDIHGNDFKNLLFGFMFSGVPSMNNWNAIFYGMHRPLVHAALCQLSCDLPLVPMTYHPNFTARTDALLSDKGNVPYPKVIKVASTHSGYGKIRVRDKDEMDDVRSILILSKDFYTTETLVENIDFEFRIQKLGTAYRGFKRISSSSWKNNWGTIQHVDYALEEKHKQWIDAASSIFGGLDICALDVLKLKDGKEVILELNGTACGLMADHEAEDATIIRDTLIEKMSAIYCK